MTVDQDELLASEAPPTRALLLHHICTRQHFGLSRSSLIRYDIDLLNIACNSMYHTRRHDFELCVASVSALWVFQLIKTPAFFFFFFNVSLNFRL